MEAIRTYSSKDLTDSLINLRNVISKLSVSFDELNEAHRVFKSNQPLPEPKSKYINKPRHNFKRR